MVLEIEVFVTSFRRIIKLDQRINLYKIGCQKPVTLSLSIRRNIHEPQREVLGLWLGSQS